MYKDIIGTMKKKIRNLISIAACVVTLVSCQNNGVTILKGHVISPVEGTVQDAAVTIKDGVIKSIEPCEVAEDAPFLLPGFVDSHVHIESSMMLPSEFARLASTHGSVGAVCDPHEIANVLGIKGVELMLDNAKNANFHFAFCAPSCVPSCGTDIETSGEIIDSKGVEELLRRDDIYALGEMMNYPGVLNEDSEVMAKIAAAKASGKPIDGHAPGLMGEERIRYAGAGISTDHECSEYSEALDAINAGMMVLIREGSSAKNYDALAPLITEHSDALMFCTDDSHPADLVNKHIDEHIRYAIADGYSLIKILRIASVNPVNHYKLPIGLLRVGDSADLIAISDTTASFKVLETFINGKPRKSTPSYAFDVNPECSRCVAARVTPSDIQYMGHRGNNIPQIVATDRSLLTDKYVGPLDSHSQKLVVYNRYKEGAKPQVAYIRGFELKHGAWAQTIAHDCHNIIAVGADDEMICDVINRVIELKGGIVATDGQKISELALPIAGLISPLPGEILAEKNQELEYIVHRDGTLMDSPFITLGFMALPVIPVIKLTDKGLFDSTIWSMVER